VLPLCAYRCTVILTDLVVDTHEFEARTGWAIKPEGMCKGEVCVPLPESARATGSRLDARVLSERLGMPLVAHQMNSGEADGVWALGPATEGTGRVLTTAIAPDLVLPQADGNPFRLATLHGRKVLLVAWASW